MEVRMKKSRIVAIVMLIVMVSAGFTSCKSAPKEKTFSKAGVEITLTEDFVEKDIVSQTAYFESMKSIVMVLKEEFTLFESVGLSTDMSMEEYAEIIFTGNNIESVVEEKDSLSTFTYENSVSGKDFTYFATLFRSDDAYWMIQFACETKDFESMSDQFMKWAKTVKFE